MNDVLDDMNNYNKNRDKKVLIVFDNMIAVIEYNKSFKQIIKELFYRARKINVSIVFITQSYFRALKDARLKVEMFKRLKNIEDNLVEVDDNDNKVGIFRIIKDIKDRGIKIDNDDEAVREIRERIKELIDDGVKVNNFNEMKNEIIDHVKKLKGQGTDVKVDEDQINDLINKIFIKI